MSKVVAGDSCLTDFLCGDQPQQIPRAALHPAAQAQIGTSGQAQFVAHRGLLPTCLSRQFEHGPGRPLGDEDVPGAEASDDGRHRERIGVDPGTGIAHLIPAQFALVDERPLVLVGTAHTGDTFTLAQLRVPYRQRLVVGDDPRRPPDLDAIGLEQIAELPGRAIILGMVDRKERTPRSHRFPHLRHLVVAPTAELDEAVNLPVNRPDIGVAVVSGDFDTGDEEQAGGGVGWQQG